MEKPNFTSFELAYSNGWTNGPTFWVDSTGIFFVPLTSELLQYGQLPDSIVRLIDNTLTHSIQISSIKSKDDRCEDCPLIVIFAKMDGKDIRIIQAGKIDSSLLTIVRNFEKFLKTERQKTINATLVLETQKIVWPPPPPPLPLPKDLKLITPRQDGNGSR